MKKLANLKKELPKKSKLNAFQVRSLKGGTDRKRKARVGEKSSETSPIPTLDGGS